SFGGIDANGFPFYLWRESADNRLTLGRPRYCCLTPVDGELYFTFFNPSANVRQWEIVIALVGMIAIVLLVNFGLAERPIPRPYHLDESFCIRLSL
ncbi:hypothetical protein ABTM46_18990, partial [Acinetobacter baumannii]